MTFQSSYSKRAYLAAMKQNMSGHSEFGSERFTGFFVGPCFYVTYHSGYEWNRRITNEKNSAMGFVTNSENGSTVHFARFKGLLGPVQFLSLLLFMLVFCPILSMTKDYGLDLSTNLWIAVISVVIVAPIWTFFESMTERSEQGRRTLLSMLADPADPYANYSKIP